MITRIHTADGLALEAEHVAASTTRRATAVLCHPHPQYGGTMRSLVISELFRALPAAGVECLRFNYRGVERSEGGYTGGPGERTDVLGAVDALTTHAGADRRLAVPNVLVGWSFGADMALSIDDPRVAGWVGIALPVRFGDAATMQAVADDERPKHLVLAAHDEFRPAEWVIEHTAGWRATTTEIVAGASHFFVGRTDRVVAETLRLIEQVQAPVG